jgi:hypothetical protein
MKIKNIISFLFIIMLIMFIGFGFLADYHAKKIYLAYNFSGIVDHVEYDNKGYPEVTVNGEQYYLQIGWNYYHIIEEGDSLKKDSGKIMITLIKHENGKVLKFDHR